MNAFVRGLRGFGAFWWDFIVGDDWLVAAGVVLGLSLAAFLAHAGVPAWWVLPVALVVTLPLSLRRAVRRSGRD